MKKENYRQMTKRLQKRTWRRRVIRLLGHGPKRSNHRIKSGIWGD